MIIFKKVLALQQHLEKLRQQQKTIGFVPTMGALHAGHLALVQQCRQNSDASVVSIFVNPAQFNDPKDFEKYPVTIDKDCQLLEEEKTDILFLPSVAEMYPEGIAAHEHFELGKLENILEGQYRPGHFQGVCRAVKKLLEIVQPVQLFMGQKDYQQCMVVQRLIQLMNIALQLHIVPTVREADGLAMSSRNVRLSPQQRQQATAIYRELQFIKNHSDKKSSQTLEDTATAGLLSAGFAGVDYVQIADAADLQPIPNISMNEKAVALVAAFIGDVRLIDNLLLR